MRLIGSVGTAAKKIGADRSSDKGKRAATKRCQPRETNDVNDSFPEVHGKGIS